MTARPAPEPLAAGKYDDEAFRAWLRSLPEVEGESVWKGPIVAALEAVKQEGEARGYGEYWYD